MPAIALALLGSAALFGTGCTDSPPPACHIAQVDSAEDLGADARVHFIEALRATERFREVNSEGRLSRPPHLYVDLVAYPSPRDHASGSEHGFGFRIRGPDSGGYVEIDTRQRRSVFGDLLFSLREALFAGRFLSTEGLADALAQRWGEIENLTACIRIR